MKVKDLIEILQKVDNEKDVVIIDEFEEIGLPDFVKCEEDDDLVFLSFTK